MERYAVRLRYGERTMRFILLLCRVKLDGGRDAALMAELRALGEALRESHEGLTGYDLGERMENELAASWNEAAYRKLTENVGGNRT